MFFSGTLGFFLKSGSGGTFFPDSLVFLIVRIASAWRGDSIIVPEENVLLVFARPARPIVTRSVTAEIPVAPNVRR